MDGKVKQLYKKAAVTMKIYGNIKIILLKKRNMLHEDGGKKLTE